MKKNIIIGLLILIFLSGCDITYDLNIKNKTIKENISFRYYPGSQSSMSNSITSGSKVSDEDKILYLINNNIYALTNNDKKIYSKKIEEFGNHKFINLIFNYKLKEYSNAYYMTNCVEKYDISFKKNKYKLHAYGKFKCLYGDKLVVRIKTNNKVIKNNADYIDNNKYIWEITSENKDNIDINIDMKKKIKLSNYYKIGGFLIFGIITIFGIMFIIVKLKRKNRF